MKIKWLELAREAEGSGGAAAEETSAGSVEGSNSGEGGAEPSAKPSPASSDDGVDLQLDGFRMNDWDSDDDSPAEAPAVQKKAEEPTESPAQKAEEKKAESAKSEEPAEPKKTEAAKEESTKTEAEPAKPEAQPATSETRRALSELLAEGREKVTGELQKLYSISDDDLDAFDTDIESRRNTLTKLAANLHFNVLQQMTAIMEQQVPQMVMATNQQTGVRGAIEKEFVEAFPDLGSAALPQFWAYAEMIAKQAPNTPTSEVVKQVGTFLAVQAGKYKPEAAKPAPKPKPQAAFQPAAASAPLSQEPPKPKPGSIESQLIGFESLDEE